MTTTLTADGLLEIPEVFRKADALQPGQRCEIERVGRGEYRLHVKADAKAELPDLVDWLFACPEKDWLENSARDSRPTLKPTTVFEE